MNRLDIRDNRHEEEYSESDLSSEEALEKTISQIRIKTVKNLSLENLNLSSQSDRSSTRQYKHTREIA